VEWLACEAKPPGVNWLSDEEEAADVAAPHVPAEAWVDQTEARKQLILKSFPPLSVLNETG
jgi:hypothetical protein